MGDIKQMPADGGGGREGAADGVSGTPGEGHKGEVHGRTEGGESGGGGYPNPHEGGGSENSGFMGHGGQSQIDYHGGGQAGEGGDAPNAATGAKSSDGSERNAVPTAAPERATREVRAGGQAFQVIEASGVAEAETTGKVGTDAPYEREQESPGSG